MNKNTFQTVKLEKGEFNIYDFGTVKLHAYKTNDFIDDEAVSYTHLDVYKRQVVEQHILEYGVTEFIVGHYGGFDRLAASAVKEAKRFYPEVKLTLLLSYHPAERPIPTPDGFDGTFYPPGMESVPRKIAIVRANRYVVDHVRCV